MSTEQIYIAQPREWIDLDTSDIESLRDGFTPVTSGLFPMLVEPIIPLPVWNESY